MYTVTACCLGIPNTTVIANKEKVLHLGVARIDGPGPIDALVRP